MYRKLRIGVVMPIYNEGPRVESAISRVPSCVDQIVAIDDGSTDDTWRRLVLIDDARLVRLRHGANRGVGAATKTGYRYCIGADLDLVAVMDGDGQMDGRDLSGLLDCVIEGADYAKGTRFASETISAMPVARYVGNVVLSWLTRRATQFGRPLDAQCGYTGIRRSALERINLDELYDRYGFPNEMFFAALRAGLIVEVAPVTTIYADEVSGINPLTAVPVIFFLIARGFVRGLIMSKQPARLVTLPFRESEAGD